MRNSIALCCALSFISIGLSQINENFSSGNLTPTTLGNGYTMYYGDIPQGWIEYNVDQQPLYWTIDGPMDGKGFRSTIEEINGVEDTVAVAWSFFDTGSGTANDWLITPNFSVPNLSESQEAFLFWEHRAYQGDELGYEVLISTAGNETSDFATVLWTAPTGGYSSEDFTLNDLDLSAYEGQNVYIAFHYFATQTGFAAKLTLDDIQVKVIEDYDVAVQSLSNLRYQKSTESQSIGVEIFNWGNPITRFDAVLSDGVNSNTMTVTGVNIPQFSSYNFEHSTAYLNNTAGEYPISISIQNINGTNEVDTDLSNNTGETKIRVVSNNQDRNVFVEEYTGTWCPACPLGTAVIDQIGNQQITDGSFIPVVVHSQLNDPMTIVEYWQEINLSAAPSCQMDRHPNFSQLLMGFSATYNQVLEKRDMVTPAKVSQVLSYNENTENLTIDCSATFYTDISTELRFASVITEDSLTGTTSDWDQQNSYSGSSSFVGGFENLPDPVPASMMVYDHVGRALIGGFHGQPNSIVGAIQNGDTKTHTFNYTIPDTFNINKLHIVTFVIDHETGEILNSISSSIDDFNNASTNSISESNFDFNVFPSPLSLSSDNLNIQLEGETTDDYHLTMHSMSGRLVYEKHLGFIGSKNAFTLSLPENISPGLYHIGIGTDKSTKIQKIMISK